MKNDNILNPLVVLEGDKILDGLDLCLEDCDYNSEFIDPFKDMMVSEYKSEIRALRKSADYNPALEKEVARKYIGWFAYLKNVDNSRDLEELKMRFLKATGKLNAGFSDEKEILEDYKQRLEKFRQSLVRKRYKNGEIGVLELHFQDVSPLDKTGLKVRSKLKAATTDELERKYKLSDKSMGHQYLLLLGDGSIDLKGNPVSKGSK